MNDTKFAELFSPQTLLELFPPQRADEFFEALFGDASEGAYDISLSYKGANAAEIAFDINLTQRPGSCLVCSLTYGLPEVFTRHPIINIAGLVKNIDERLGDLASCGDWQLKRTNSISSALHTIPLTIKLI